MSPGHVEDYLRSLAAQKEPTLSTPSEKPAFVCSICPLGKRFVVSRITVICKFDGPVGHRQRGNAVSVMPLSPALHPAQSQMRSSLQTMLSQPIYPSWSKSLQLARPQRVLWLRP